ASLTITTLTGSPFIEVARSTPLRATFLTSFGSQCSGYDLDNTMKLGSEWFDTDGLSYGGPAQHAPILLPAADMSVDEGALSDQVLSATDGDGDALTFSKTAGPAFLTVTTTNPGSGTATGNAHLAPGFQDAGNYQAQITVADPLLFTDSRDFAISVA